MERNALQFSRTAKLPRISRSLSSGRPLRAGPVRSSGLRPLLLHHPRMLPLAPGAASAWPDRLGRRFAVGEKILDRRARRAAEVHAADAQLHDRALGPLRL